MQDATAAVSAPTPPAAVTPAGLAVRGPFARFVAAVVAQMTPWRCRAIFALLLALGFYSNWRYLNYNCPIDLAGDEAHYWDWSRSLDLAYYSKGPGVAYIIRASCAIFGDNMPAVRLPALLLAIGTATATYWLILRLFKSDRLALGMTLISAFVPAFMAGGLLMTIDPPFFFLWGLTTCFAVLAVLEDKKWAWIGIGLAIGLGALAKYAMYLWLVGFVLFLILDKPSRRHLRSPWLYAAMLISAAFLTPVLVWNARYGWVTAKHINADTNTGFKVGNVFEMLGAQAGILGLSLFFILLGAVAYVFRREGKADPNHRSLLFLTTIGLAFFAICFLNSFRSHIQPNWPAPAYFTLLILVPYFLSIRLRQKTKWRPWWIGNLGMTVVTGIILTPVARDPSKIYWILPYANSVVTKFREKPLKEKDLDPTVRLRGWEELGQAVGKHLQTLPPDAFVMSEDYARSSLMAFYVPGQPKTYCASSYVHPPRRTSQFDIWEDRALEPNKTDVLGKDCVFVGMLERYQSTLKPAFESVERQPDVEIFAGGAKVSTYEVWVCRGFKGMRRPIVAKGNY